MSEISELLREISDIRRRVEALGRLESSSSGLPANVVKFSGTPTAGNYAYWTGDGTVANSGFGTSQLPRYSGTPTAGAITYWTGAGTVAHATFGTVDVVLTAGAQSIAGVKTFSDGISFGVTTLNINTRSTWSPAITGSSSNPTISYTTQTGEYVRTGNSASGQSKVDYAIEITILATSGGNGTMRVSLPFTVVGVNPLGLVLISGPDVGGTPIGLAFEPQAGQSYGVVRLINDNAGIINLTIADLAAGDTIRLSGFYFA